MDTTTIVKVTNSDLDNQDDNIETDIINKNFKIHMKKFAEVIYLPRWKDFSKALADKNYRIAERLYSEYKYPLNYMIILSMCDEQNAPSMVFLFKLWNIKREDIINNIELLYFVCNRGNLACLIALDDICHFEKKDFLINTKHTVSPLYVLCERNEVEQIMWLVNKFDFTNEDLSSPCNIFTAVCLSGNVELVKTLYDKWKFTRKNMPTYENHCLSSSCRDYNIEMALLLDEYCHFTVEELRNNDNFMLLCALENGYDEMALWLHKKCQYTQSELQNAMLTLMRPHQMVGHSNKEIIFRIVKKIILSYDDDDDDDDDNKDNNIKENNIKIKLKITKTKKPLDDSEVQIHIKKRAPKKAKEPVVDVNTIAPQQNVETNQIKKRGRPKNQK